MRLTCLSSVIDTLQLPGSSRTSYLTGKTESNMLKLLPKMLSGVSQNFHLLCSSVFPLYLYYAPRLAKFLTIIWNILRY